MPTRYCGKRGNAFATFANEAALKMSFLIVWRSVARNCRRTMQPASASPSWEHPKLSSQRYKMKRTELRGRRCRTHSGMLQLQELRSRSHTIRRRYASEFEMTASALTKQC